MAPATRSIAGLVVLRAEALHTEPAVEHEPGRARLAVERAGAVALAAVVVTVPAAVCGLVEP